jgi:hypothetical protein
MRHLLHLDEVPAGRPAAFGALDHGQLLGRIEGKQVVDAGGVRRGRNLILTYFAGVGAGSD